MNQIENQMMKIRNPQSAIRNSSGFTLVELLIVISIIGILAAFTIAGLGAIKKKQYRVVARAELEVIETALDSFKAKYGTYPQSNQKNNSGYAGLGQDRSQFNPLYYELSGVTFNSAANTFTTLDGLSQISAGNVNAAFGTGGFVNCTKGSGDDGTTAKGFLLNLKPSQYNTFITNSGVRTTELVTSVGGHDDTYMPIGGVGINPFRYVYPGTNNPGSYDLWVQLSIGGKKYLICNWSRQEIINSPLP